MTKRRQLVCTTGRDIEFPKQLKKKKGYIILFGQTIITNLKLLFVYTRVFFSLLLFFVLEYLIVVRFWFTLSTCSYTMYSIYKLKINNVHVVFFFK